MEKILFCCLLGLTVQLFANNSIATLENDPSTIVEGRVNVITGEAIFFQEDLIVKGAEPIRIERAYVNGPQGKWYWGVFGTLHRLRNGNLIVTEKNGVPIEYGKKKKIYVGLTKYYRYEPLSTGFSNTAHGKISSRTNFKNYYILLDEKSGSFEVHAPDGAVRRYELDRGGHHLHSEKLPNGNWVLYEYEEVIVDKKRDLFTYNLKSIRTTNPAQTKVYATADVYLEDPKLRNQHLYIRGSDGGSVEYQYQNGKKPHSGSMSAVLSTDFPSQKLSFVRYTPEVKKLNGNHHAAEECRLQSLTLPLGREFRFDYYQNDAEIVAGITIEMDDYWIGPLNPAIDPRRNRVKALLSPVGIDAKLHPTHSFVYDLKNQKTSVYEINGIRIDYSWDSSLRLEKIERFSKENNRLNGEKYVWGREGPDYGNLISKTYFDESGNEISSKKYVYDAKGNIIQERFYGNLSGEGAGQEEFYARNFKYSNDEPSLLIEESDDSGLRIVYAYLPGTDLLVSQLTYDGEEVKLRKFWEYDADHILFRQITDNGNLGVKILAIKSFDSGPWIGMPEILEEKYGEEERLLKRTILTYDAKAQIIQKDIYDAEGNFRYRLNMSYDDQGRLVEERNALGQVAKYEYDACWNRTSAKEYNNKVTKISYDRSNRPIFTEILGEDGIGFCSRTAYDLKHQIISEVDIRGHETKYSYDLLGHCIKTELPPHPNVFRYLTSHCTESAFDSVGNEVQKIDAAGHKTEISYNAYGKPIAILHPDGAQERLSYYLNGLLKTHTDPLGICTHYVYDFLGRLVEKKIEDCKETYEYSGEYLIAKTDANGNRTVYTYDGAGRKSSEELGGERIAYFYDSLGRVSRICRADQELIYEYDLLDRIVEEKEECSGKVIRKVQYEYDEAGNRKTIIRHIAGREAKEMSRYDSLNRLVEKIDALGTKETIEYEDHFVNECNQKVLRKTTTDALGLQTIETFDTYNRLANVEKKKDKILFLEERFHDQRGLLKSQTNTVFSFDGIFLRKVDTEWDYDNRGRLIALKEAEGKVTHYTYTPRGELKEKIKPDGTILRYKYNNLGHLTSLFSSDNTVNHSMRYDSLGRLIAFDGIDRTLDAHGRILNEQFPKGYSVENLYDHAGRRIESSIAAADCSIAYQYNASYMTRVTRKTTEGRNLYSHGYLDYDLSGNILKEESIEGLSIDYKIDPLSRKCKLEAPNFSQEILRFDPVGNILEMQIQEDRIHYIYDDLYQLTSETGLLSHRYSFDSLNNRLQKDEENYEINKLHQVISHLRYDPNGNPIQKGETHYTYDALDRLICLETPTFTQTFTYDVLHRCLKKTSSREKTEHYIYDGSHEIGSFDEKLNLLDLRILGATSHAEIGATIAIERGGNIYAPVHDLQGNLAVLTPQNESWSNYFHYSAFGEELSLAPTLSPWRYCSKRSDPETGLVNFGRRFYLPSLGRWLTPDPAGFTDGMNLYAYVHNAPLTHLDEYGLLTYVHGHGWQNNPWGSPFSYSSTHLGTPFFARPPEKWNLAQVDARQIPSMDLYYQRSPHYYVNGILNSRKDCLEGAEALRKSLGGMANVIPIHSPSKGLYKDFKSLFKTQKSNYHSSATRKLNREIVFSSLCMDLLDDPRKLFITAFSRGAAEVFHSVKNLSIEQKNRLIITACGPIMILPRDLGFSVTNLISQGDNCSLFCNRELKKDMFCYDDVAFVRILSQKDGFCKITRDHFFLSRTYQEEINRTSKIKYETYGVER